MRLRLKHVGWLFLVALSFLALCAGLAEMEVRAWLHRRRAMRRLRRWQKIRRSHEET